MNKPRIVKDYQNLSEDVQQQIKLVYPLGFRKHLVSYVNKDGVRKQALPFETEEFYYLIRMTEEKAENIVEQDEDFDDDGTLKDSVKEKYEDKFDDLDYLTNNANDDNEFEGDEDEDDDF